MIRRIAAIARPSLLAGLAIVVLASAARAEKVSNPIAAFTGLDKITARVTQFDVYMDEKVRFGSLLITPRVCYNRPATEEPRTDAFVEIDEIGLDNRVSRVFTGWMIAGSPGLHAVDNPVYDVWLTDCKMTSDVPPPNK